VSPAPGGEPELDAADIQGHVLPGFRRPAWLLVGLAIDDRDALRAVARAVAPRVTSLDEALDHKTARKEIRLGLRAAHASDGPFLAVAFSARALGYIPGGADVVALDSSFEAGMSPTSTGDASAPTLPDGTDNASARVHWRVGNDEKPLDALLIMAGDSDSELATFYVALASGWVGAHVRETYREVGERFADETEHFGFRDGISIPGVFGRVTGRRGSQLLTTRHGVPDGPDGVKFGRPGQPLVWPAQFLFGTHASATRVAAAPALARNGSLLVFRRLAQDVPAFRAETAAIAAALSGGANGVVSEELARAWLIGRWPNGEPLARSPGAPRGNLSELETNYFSYQNASPAFSSGGRAVSPAAADPSGARCPLFAHVRKVNPRDRPTDQGPPAITQGMQMLRRGVPYGPRYDLDHPQSPGNARERGLLFLTYQTSIANQFERIQTRWANQPNAPELPVGDTFAGHDALIGTATTPARVPGPRIVRHDDRSANVLARWVTLTGGGYLFAPGRAALRAFAG